MSQDRTSASIADVAERARVSISTVSRVINRPDLVNARTRARVERAIEALGYRPNPFARALMLRRSDLIGLILPDMHGEFYPEVIRGADQQARALGYQLVVSASQHAEDSDALLSAIAGRALVDGVAIMLAEISDRVERVLADLRQPFVLLDGDVVGPVHDSVVIDQAYGVRKLVRHLVEARGVRRVVFVGGQETNVDTIARMTACREVLAEHQLTLHPDDIHFLDYTYETALGFARSRVREWAGGRCAVFAANDEMAVGILAATHEEGVAVPGELAMVGFDDVRIARMTSPPLTTVRVPMAQMGARAIELLCARIADPDRAPERVSLQPELVVRRSCGADQAGSIGVRTGA